MNITAVNVFIEVDGKQCIALIDPKKVELFVGMLPVAQADGHKNALLHNLPPSVVEPLQRTRVALYEYVTARKAAAA